VIRPKIALPLIATLVILCTVAATLSTKTTASPDRASCASEVGSVDLALSQVHFSRATVQTVGAAVALSEQRRRQYLATSSALERQLFVVHSSARQRERLEAQLAQADTLLLDDASDLTEAQKLLDDEHQSVAEGSSQVDAAAEQLTNGDCAMAARLMRKSGWPKDAPYGELSTAAHLNVEASSQLDSALGIIIAAQRAIRSLGGTVSNLR